MFWTIYLAMLPPLLVLTITSLVRANDIGWAKKNWHWNLRRMALVCVGSSSAGLIFTPLWFFNWPRLFVFCVLALVYGFAAAWLTTPGMPPWWRYITGQYKRLPDILL